MRDPLIRLRRLVAQLGKRRGRLVNISVTLEQEQVQWLEGTGNVSRKVRELVKEAMAKTSEEGLRAAKAELKALEDEEKELSNLVPTIFYAMDFQIERKDSEKPREREEALKELSRLREQKKKTFERLKTIRDEIYDLKRRIEDWGLTEEQLRERALKGFLGDSEDSRH